MLLFRIGSVTYFSTRSSDNVNCQRQSDEHTRMKKYPHSALSSVCTHCIRRDSLRLTETTRSVITVWDTPASLLFPKKSGDIFGSPGRITLNIARRAYTLPLKAGAKGDCLPVSRRERGEGDFSISGLTFYAEKPLIPVCDGNQALLAPSLCSEERKDLYYKRSRTVRMRRFFAKISETTPRGPHGTSFRGERRSLPKIA